MCKKRAVSPEKYILEIFCQLNKKQKWGSSVLLISLSQKAGAMKKTVLAFGSSFTAFSLTMMRPLFY